MTRATLCLAIFFTLWLSLFDAMTGGSPWPMLAAAVLALVAPSLLRRQDTTSYQRRI